MRLAAVVVLVAAGCASGPASTEARDDPVRLFVAGAVDLTGRAAVVARADPEGIFRDVRLAARRADLAIVVSSEGEAGPLLAAAGFDVVACPQPESLTSSPAGLLTETGAVRLSCGADAGLAADDSSPGLTLTVWNTPAVDAGAPRSDQTASVELIVPRVGPPGVVVSSVGALLSDDSTAGGAVLEVLADEVGVIAYRIGRTTHGDFRVHFKGWDLPKGDATLLDGEWWTLARATTPVSVLRPLPGIPFAHGELTVAALGDITGDGLPDMAAAYLHPLRWSALTDTFPGAVGVDSRGRSAHLGVFTPEGEALWAAGLIPHPVGDVAACDGSVALAYTEFDDPGVTGTGAGVWQGMSLSLVQELPGTGAPGCADVDGDGALDPVILERSP